MTHGDPQQSSGRLLGGGHHRVERFDDRHSQDRAVPPSYRAGRHRAGPAARRRWDRPRRRARRWRRHGVGGDGVGPRRGAPRPRERHAGAGLARLRGPRARPRRPRRRASVRCCRPPAWAPASRPRSSTWRPGRCCSTSTATPRPSRRPRRSSSPPPPRSPRWTPPRPCRRRSWPAARPARSCSSAAATRRCRARRRRRSTPAPPPSPTSPRRSPRRCPAPRSPASSWTAPCSPAR